MTKCPLGGYCYRNQSAIRSEDSFDLFHAIRDAYADAQGYDKVLAKDELCCLFGVAIEDEGQLDIPKDWIACVVWNRRWLRKSTLKYTKAEMTKLIEKSINAVYEAGGELPPGAAA